MGNGVKLNLVIILTSCYEIHEQPEALRQCLTGRLDPRMATTLV